MNRVAPDALWSWTMPFTRPFASARMGMTYRFARTVTIGSPTMPAMSDERSIALSRSRTRSCDVRRRRRMAASSAEAVSSTAPAVVDAALDPLAQGGDVQQRLGELGEMAAAPAGEAVPTAPGHAQRLGHVEQLPGRHAAAAACPLQRAADVARAADPACACSSMRRAASSVCSWSRRDERRVGHRQRLARQLARGWERRQPGEQLDDRVELERTPRCRHRRRRRARAQRETWGSPSVHRRYGRAAHSPA